MASQYDALTRNRRFYKSVSTGPADGGFAILLDGRTPKTPGGARLVLPNPALAALVAEEWEAQAEFILPDEMGATRLANTVIDRIGAVRDEVAQEVARFAGSDMLCYFADYPTALVEEETLRWGPVLDWARQSLGVTLRRSVGVAHREQDPAELAKVEALALELDDFGLAGLAHLTGLLSSAILALAVQKDQLTALEAFELSRLDEAFQARQWGEDEEAAARTARLRAETALIGRWFDALR
jgi:chaperone required for assembly of F1-ATPase